jgi:hypothetical protein
MRYNQWVTVLIVSNTQIIPSFGIGTNKLIALIETDVTQSWIVVDLVGWIVDGVRVLQERCQVD